jgi:hypothetical protein
MAGTIVATSLDLKVLAFGAWRVCCYIYRQVALLPGPLLSRRCVLVTPFLQDYGHPM